MMTANIFTYRTW